MTPEPVPFTVPLPGRDGFGLDGIRSVSYRVHGLLHFDGETVTFEWRTARHVEHVSLLGVDVDDDTSEPELLDVPWAWIADARLVRAWWLPRLELRARRLDAFDGVPGAGPGTIGLRVARRHRALAAAMAKALLAPRVLLPEATEPRRVP